MKHIRATLELGNRRTETVAFPCADSKIKKMLAHRTGDDRYTVYVDELTAPAWMKPIEKTYVNIHELNYLAKRMDAMDDNELAKMGAVLSRFGGSDLSQYINYTFNLDRITLVRDISNLQKVGAMHYMETHGGYRDIFHPVTANARQKLIGATVSAYHDALQQQEQMKAQRAAQPESPNAAPRDAPIMQM